MKTFYNYTNAKNWNEIINMSKMEFNMPKMEFCMPKTEFMGYILALLLALLAFAVGAALVNNNVQAGQ